MQAGGQLVNCIRPILEELALPSHNLSSERTVQQSAMSAAASFQLGQMAAPQTGSIRLFLRRRILRLRSEDISNW
eukprot:1640720-Prorocentrum_lima.AAC.1